MPAWNSHSYRLDQSFVAPEQLGSFITGAQVWAGPPLLVGGSFHVDPVVRLAAGLLVTLDLTVVHFGDHDRSSLGPHVASAAQPFAASLPRVCDANFRIARDALGTCSERERERERGERYVLMQPAIRKTSQGAHVLAVKQHRPIIVQSEREGNVKAIIFDPMFKVLKYNKTLATIASSFISAGGIVVE